MRDYKPQITIESFGSGYARRWWWFLRATNGKIMASKGHFSSKYSCLDSYRLTKKLMMPDLEINEKS